MMMISRLRGAARAAGRPVRRWTLLLACVAAPAAAAATVDVNARSAWGIEDAFRRAGVNGTVNLRQDLRIDRPAVLRTAGVTFRGNGFRLFEGPSKPDMLRLEAAGIRLEGIEFVAQPSLPTGDRFRAMVVPGAENLTISGCTFRNGSGGIRKVGESPRGLRVLGNTFWSVPTAIAWNRDVIRIPGTNPVGRAVDGGRFVIGNNTIHNPSIAGITIDAGNDAGTAPNGGKPLAGNGDPRFPQAMNPLRYQMRGRTTGFFVPGAGRSWIGGNRVLGVGGFGIALARVSGIDVVNNVVTVAKRGKPYRRGIHLENRTRGVDVRDNRVNVLGGSGFPSAYGMVTFTDYGNDAAYANGVRAVRFINNRAWGGGRGYVGRGFSGIAFERNRAGSGVRPYDFANAPGGSSAFSVSRDNAPFNP
ncbi:right-handed parallel beta-helix repeat-containing protein [Phycisphaera mikurensis]|uniref:Putative beta-agarase n=1 Tax=Phycisphaera mikurensis (strain NBRC 102666 / KCTC 22515 / FYK2301M01) TaxID=1142394 RepID=I0II28_PHYMF|nr:right-handed parallel beta-helix repeat-containing protein [Phycisphaera mikurensis]MBB6442520.1 hypothetical protein [Phycisphaera mikurensis]BAM04916.1 putative beta-agarase [Phycisphaera mikurensis NBRC 102666]